MRLNVNDPSGLLSGILDPHRPKPFKSWFIGPGKRGACFYHKNRPTRYPGSVLRQLRAERGVGRPPKLKILGD